MKDDLLVSTFANDVQIKAKFRFFMSIARGEVSFFHLVYLVCIAVFMKEKKSNVEDWEFHPIEQLIYGSFFLVKLK